MKWKVVRLNVSEIEDHSEPDVHFALVLLCMYPTKSQMNGSKSRNFNTIKAADSKKYDMTSLNEFA